MKKIITLPMCGDGVDLGLCIVVAMPKGYKILSHRTVNNQGVLYVEINPEETETEAMHLHLVTPDVEYYTDGNEFVAHWILQNDATEVDVFCFLIPEDSEWGYLSNDYATRFESLENLTEDDFRKLLREAVEQDKNEDID